MQTSKLIGFCAALLTVTLLEGAAGQSGSGECSWYGKENEIPQGHPTACGNGFDRFALAASQLGALNPKLPCGTKVRVVNLENGKTVDVILNDRGTHATRILDLTYEAFGRVEDRDKGHFRCSYTVIQ